MREHRLDGVPGAVITVRTHEQENGSYTLRVRAVRVSDSPAIEGMTDTAEWGVGVYPIDSDALQDLETEDCREQIRDVVRAWLRALEHLH